MTRTKTRSCRRVIDVVVVSESTGGVLGGGVGGERRESVDWHPGKLSSASENEPKEKREDTSSDKMSAKSFANLYFFQHLIK